MSTVVPAAHRRDFADGAVAILPVALAVVPFGLLLGALAARAGLSPVEVALMGATVFAGGAQFVAVGLWIEPAPVLLLTLTTLMINLRHVLMGATLVGKLPRQGAYGALFFLADETWALALKRAAERPLTVAYLLGLGVVLHLNWVFWTTAGALLGAMIADPARYGFDFAFSAIFIGLLVGLYQGPRDLAPWAASGVAAALAYLALPPPWYILVGGLTGAAVGASSPPRP